MPQGVALDHMRQSEVRVELYRALDRSQGFVEPTRKDARAADCEIRIRFVLVQLGRPASQAECHRDVAFGVRGDAMENAHTVGISQAGSGGLAKPGSSSIARLRNADRGFAFLGGVSKQVPHAALVVFPGVEVVGRLAQRPHLFGEFQLWLQGPGRWRRSPRPVRQRCPQGRGRNVRPRDGCRLPASISWAVTRTRLPALRTLPSRT